MKFPLSEEPFHTATLSPEQINECATTAEIFLEESVAEYQAFLQLGRRGVNQELWKPVKMRDSITVFKQRDAPDETARVIPKLLLYGTVNGTLDDLMYGQMTPDSNTFKIKSSYIHDEIVDGRMLFQMKHPTDEDPFRSLGIKWLVKSHTPSISAIVKPRDFVMIDSMGVHVLSNGERIGYHVLYSVDMPDRWPELKQLGIVRGKLAVCYLFRQLRKDAVETYTKALVDPGGQAPRSIAIMSAANALLGCRKLVLCAQSKKLAWLTTEASKRRGSVEVVDAKIDSKNGCGVCMKPFSSLSRGGVCCQLCSREVCNKCRAKVELSRIVDRSDRGKSNGDEVIKVESTFCSDCLTRARRVNSAEIARFEFVPGALERKQMRGAGEAMRKNLPPKTNNQIRAATVEASLNMCSTIKEEEVVADLDAIRLEDRSEQQGRGNTTRRLVM